METLASALFSGVQQRILGTLFGMPERSFYRNELMRLTGSGKGALQRELDRLEEAGLVQVRAVGNQKHYQANKASPIFSELRGIAVKALKVPERVHAAHEPRAAYDVAVQSLRIPQRKLRELCRKYRIRKLSVFGSAARGELRRDSDIDLMVEFEPDRAPSLWDFPEMQSEFSKLFAGRRVDLVPPQVLENPHRRKTIVPDLKVLYAA